MKTVYDILGSKLREFIQEHYMIDVYGGLVLNYGKLGFKVYESKESQTKLELDNSTKLVYNNNKGCLDLVDDVETLLHIYINRENCPISTFVSDLLLDIFENYIGYEVDDIFFQRVENADYIMVDSVKGLQHFKFSPISV